MPIDIDSSPPAGTSSSVYMVGGGGDKRKEGGLPMNKGRGHASTHTLISSHWARVCICAASAPGKLIDERGSRATGGDFDNF